MDKKQRIMDICAAAEKIEPELIELRRTLHMHPELSLHEVKTARIIADALQEIPGMKVYENMSGGTGVVGVLQGELSGGKCIMLRADIDALPIEEKVDVPYKSREVGCMHACGHDAHITWIVGAAKILSSMRSELAGTIKFVFQPGEEVGKGARELVEKDCILENPRVDAVFAAHVWPSISAGKIGIAARYPFGCPGGFTLRVSGKGGHGSWPYECINPITVTLQICNALQTIITDRIDSTEPRVLSICSIHAGEEGNIIPDECVIKGTIRATEMHIMEQMIAEIRKIAEGVTGMYGASYELTSFAHQAVENDLHMRDMAEMSAKEILGEENCYIIDKKHLGGENFAEYSSRVPGCYMFVGIATDETEGKFSLHSPIFEIAEEVLAPASGVFANLVFNCIKE